MALSVCVYKSFLFTFWTVLLFMRSADGIAVMSIDMGSEWLKIAIVKPGVPMEIAINTESRRKTPNIVSMKGNERLFSDPAYKVAVMYPNKAFVYLTHLIGKKFDSEPVQTYKNRFPHAKLLKDEIRGTVLFEGEDEKKYSVEQLMAMIFNSSRQIAQRFADHNIKDTVITVPVYFNQAERRAVIEAANLTGLNVLQLMNDNTAVALNYGIFRSATFNSTMKHVMFYDMGASHSTATIVEYSTTTVKDRGYSETVPQLIVKGVGFDVRLGGLEMDFRLRDHLVKVFKETVKTQGDITSNARSMAKLLKEARRVRQVLSANTNHRAQVEGLFEEKDFRATVSRDEFDTMCADLYVRVERTIKMALSASAIPKGEIESIILMGGATRIPKVQELLKSVLGKEELGKSINADEAAALGSVYRGADLTNGFKVKRFLIKDLNVFPIDVSFERKPSNADGGVAKQITRNLFHRMNAIPQRKVMTFNKKLDDFSFNVSYGDMSFLTEELRTHLNLFNVSHVQLEGVADAHEKNNKATPKGVKAYFNMDESALLHLEKVEAHFEKTPEVVKQEEEETQSTLSKIGSTLSSFFGKSNKESEETVEENKEEKPAEKRVEEKEELKADEQKQETNKNDKTKVEPKGEQKKEEKADGKEEERNDEPKNETGTKESDKLKINTTTNVTEKVANATEKVKSVIVKEILSHTLQFEDQLSLSKEAFDSSVTVLVELEARDKAKMAREQAMNEFESYVVGMRGQLTEDDVAAMITDDEKSAVEDKLNTAYEWFDEDGWNADTETLKKKLKDLRAAMGDLQFKINEAQSRPRAITEMLGSLNVTDYFLKSYKTVPDSAEIFTEKDINDIVKLQADTMDWFIKTWTKQNESLANAKPILLSKDLAFHQGKLDREIVYLMNKVRYYVPKPKPKPEANTTVSNTSKSANTTKVDEKTSVPENGTEKADNKDELNLAAGESKEEKVDVKMEETPTQEETTPKEEIPVLELPSDSSSTHEPGEL